MIYDDLSIFFRLCGCYSCGIFEEKKKGDGLERKLRLYRENEFVWSYVVDLLVE